MKQENESQVLNPIKDPKPLIITAIVCVAMIVSTTFVWHLDGVPGSMFSLTDWADTPVSLLWFVVVIPAVMLKTGGYFAKSYIRYEFRFIISASLMTSICLALLIIAICHIIVKII